MENENFLSFKPNAVGIKARAKGIDGKFTKFQGQMLEVHRRTVEQMAKWATEELDRHIRRSRTGAGTLARTGTLERAILDPGSHRPGTSGFEFLVAEEMDAKVVNPLRPTQGTYWRAIEYGSTASVGRILPLNFIDPSGHIVPPNGGRAQKEVQAGATEEDHRLIDYHRDLPDGSHVGGLDRYRYSRHRKVTVEIRTRSGIKSFQARRRPTIEVRNPIQPYHYARYAVMRFEANDYAYYKDLLRQHADALGLVMVFTR